MGARADAVTDWNDTALTATEVAPPHAENRILAMAHVTMFDAANATTRTHTPVASQLAGRCAWNLPDAAGHGVLVALAATLGKVADAVAREDGIAVGRQAAEKVLALRAGDGADKKPPTFGAVVRRPCHFEMKGERYEQGK